MMVAARRVTPDAVLLVRTRPSLMRSGTLAITAGAVPLFAVLYWLSISQGSWRRVLVVHVVFMALWAFAWFRWRRVYVRVDDERLTKQSFLVRTVVAREDVADVLIAQTYRDSSADTVPQLLALDKEGRRLFRLRGYFWTREDMLAIAKAVGVSPRISLEPLTRREFYATHPGSAYWYEGRTWLKTAGIVIALVAAAGFIGWLMTAIGTTSALGQP
jgi:hypothetical protein